MSALTAIAADHVFDGEDVTDRHAILIEDGRIIGRWPAKHLRADVPVYTLPRDAWLAPGFIDVQVNGGGDVLFNDAPTAAAVDTIAAAHRRFGTTGLMPTVITDTEDRMWSAAAAVQEAAESNPGILGIHFEGPFISPDKPGIHDPKKIRRPGPDEEFIARLHGIVTLVTLAPEEVPEGYIRSLVDAGVRVSLGHSMATYAQTKAAIAEGLTGFTHLFNAMRPLESREGGPIAAAHECADAFFGIIVDGVHVAPPTLRLALRAAAKPMLVTDAMPPVGGTKSAFTLNGRAITVQDGRCAAADGTLAGAALDMASAVRNAVTLLGVPLREALKMASAHPAQFLGLDRDPGLGFIGRDRRADLVAFMPDTMEVLATWVAGELVEHGLRKAPRTA